jgi:hypothetical protein
MYKIYKAGLHKGNISQLVIVTCGRVKYAPLSLAEDESL